MVKKKGKSKRTSLKDKYKIQRRVTETHRKRRKESKRDAASGKVLNKKKKDPGIPNSWPFKQDLLKDIQRAREKQIKVQEEAKGQRKSELQALLEHQRQGGTARSVEELMLLRASQDQAAFHARQGDQIDTTKIKERSDGTVAAGQQSRRAYLRELKKVVDTADVLLQVLDARDPMGSRIHPSIEDAILSRTDKRMVLVLNKIDLVPKDVVGAWLTALRRSRPTIAIKASLSAGRNNDDDGSTATTASSAVGMDGLLQLLKNYARTGGSGGNSKTTIVVGIIGCKSPLVCTTRRVETTGLIDSVVHVYCHVIMNITLSTPTAYAMRLLDSPSLFFYCQWFHRSKRWQEQYYQRP